MTEQRQRGKVTRPVPLPLGGRFRVQLAALVGFNSYFLSSSGKHLCIPVLNCYACPIGIVACPVGSLSAFAYARLIPFYIIGFLGIVGVTLGRALCGWACPFGWLQDMLCRLPTRKWRLPRGANSLKYALLVVLVIGLPAVVGAGRQATGPDRVVEETAGALDYCALVCPAGTLQAGVPGLITSPELRSRASWRTANKLLILLAVLALMVVSRRSFCRALCPLGAMMAATSRVCLLRLQTDPDLCTRCMRCVAVCPTRSRMVPSAAGQKEATAECILCLDCVRACPEAGALGARLAGRTIAASRDR